MSLLHRPKVFQSENAKKPYIYICLIAKKSQFCKVNFQFFAEKCFKTFCAKFLEIMPCETFLSSK